MCVFLPKRLPVSDVHKFPPGLGWPWSPGSWGSLLVQLSSLGPQRQQQVLLTLVMVIRTKQIIGLKLCSCFLLLPAAAARPLIGSLLSWDQRAHTHWDKHTHAFKPTYPRPAGSSVMLWCTHRKGIEVILIVLISYFVCWEYAGNNYFFFMKFQHRERGLDAIHASWPRPPLHIQPHTLLALFSVSLRSEHHICRADTVFLSLLKLFLYSYI